VVVTGSVVVVVVVVVLVVVVVVVVAFGRVVVVTGLVVVVTGLVVVVVVVFDGLATPWCFFRAGGRVVVVVVVAPRWRRVVFTRLGMAVAWARTVDVGPRVVVDAARLGWLPAAATATARATTHATRIGRPTRESRRGRRLPERAASTLSSNSSGAGDWLCRGSALFAGPLAPATPLPAHCTVSTVRDGFGHGPPDMAPPMAAQVPATPIAVSGVYAPPMCSGRADPPSTVEEPSSAGGG
jgi:hypothetical protein